MQDRYVADVGDFGKYGLLRVLCNTTGFESGPRLRLGVVWYLFSSKEERKRKPGDGRKTDYAWQSNKERFRPRDEELYDVLVDILWRKERNVVTIQKSNILGRDAAFHDSLLTYDETDGDARKEARTRWLNRAQSKMENCDVVLLDPDNGLEPKSVRPWRKNGPKYVYYDEVKPYLGRNQSVVIYHHLGRNKPGKRQVLDRLKQLETRLVLRQQPFALWYHAGSPRVFFVLPSRTHQVLLRRAKTKLKEKWGDLFDLYP